MTATLEKEARTGDLREIVGIHYLLMIGENYLRPDAEVDVRDLLERIIDTHDTPDDSMAAFVGLLQEADWRDQVVGVHGLIALRRRDGEPPEENGFHLDSLRSPFCFLTTRPKLLAAVILRDLAPIEAVLRTKELDEDSLDVYAAACAAADLLHEDVGLAILADVMRDQARVSPYYDADAFAASEQRFRRAYEYWTRQRDD